MADSMLQAIIVDRSFVFSLIRHFVTFRPPLTLRDPFRIQALVSATVDRPYARPGGHRTLPCYSYPSAPGIMPPLLVETHTRTEDRVDKASRLADFMVRTAIAARYFMRCRFFISFFRYFGFSLPRLAPPHPLFRSWHYAEMPVNSRMQRREGTDEASRIADSMPSVRIMALYFVLSFFRYRSQMSIPRSRRFFRHQWTDRRQDHSATVLCAATDTVPPLASRHQCPWTSVRGEGIRWIRHPGSPIPCSRR